MSENAKWITQTQAAKLKDMTLAAIHALAVRGRIRTKEVYGKTLVSLADVMAYEPMTRNKWSKKASKKKGRKKT